MKRQIASSGCGQPNAGRTWPGESTRRKTVERYEWRGREKLPAAETEAVSAESAYQAKLQFIRSPDKRGVRAGILVRSWRDGDRAERQDVRARGRSRCRAQPSSFPGIRAPGARITMVYGPEYRACEPNGIGRTRARWYRAVCLRFYKRPQLRESEKVLPGTAS